MEATVNSSNLVVQARSTKSQWAPYVVCWLLGNGTVFSWNSMLTVQDYFAVVFPEYHPVRVFTLVYQPFALGTIAIFTYYEAKVNTRLRILSGYSMFFLFVLLIPVVDLATTGRGGIGPYIGTCALIAGFGVADAHVQGGMYGDLSYMRPEFIQSYAAGLAASGTATSALRMMTKAAFGNSRDGLRKGAILFFFMSAFFEFICIILYAFVFPQLEAIKHYRLKAAAEGSMTVNADLAAGGLSPVGSAKDTEEANSTSRLSNLELIRRNIDYIVGIVLIYSLSLSIFPGFLAEDTGKHQLGSWYAITLIALFNVGDLMGRYVPLIDCLMLTSRRMLMTLSLSRFVLIPAFLFTAKYGDQGWMLMLTVLLGLSNGYLTICVFVNAPKGYTGPEQNAIGNILVLFLVVGLFLGVTLDWLWLIGKKW